MSNLKKPGCVKNRDFTVLIKKYSIVTNQEINFLSKGHSTQGSKKPFISNLKKPACASKWDMLEIATFRYYTYRYEMKFEICHFDLIRG